MNNFGIAFKKFITNKNTVTIIGIIVILILLYVGYDRTVKSSVDPVNVPVAKNRIIAEHEITYDDIAYKKVSRVVLSQNVLTNVSLIVGKYTNLGVTIPEGSMFYSEWLVSADKVPGKWIEQVDFANGEEAYYYNTDAIETLGNSVLPNSYVDIYMRAEDENGNIMFGKLLENIKVLVVHDGSGNNVFADSSAIGSPAYLGFALSHDFYVLLNKAKLGGVELTLAPQGTVPQIVSGENTIMVGSETLRDYIDAKTVSLDDEHVEKKETKSNNSDDLNNILTNNSDENSSNTINNNVINNLNN